MWTDCKYCTVILLVTSCIYHILACKTCAQIVMSMQFDTFIYIKKQQHNENNRCCFTYFTTLNIMSLARKEEDEKGLLIGGGE